MKYFKIGNERKIIYKSIITCIIIEIIILALSMFYCMLQSSENEQCNTIACDFSQISLNLSNSTNNDFSEEDFTWENFETVWLECEDYFEQNPQMSEAQKDEYFRNRFSEYLNENEAMELPLAGVGDIWDRYKNLKKAEKEFIFAHPVKAYKIYKSSLKAFEKTDYYYEGNHSLDNGDAFRHGYWNALMARTVGVTSAKEFADAHESEDSTGLDLEMDLYNNEQGRSDGILFEDLSEDELAEEIMHRVSSGYYKRIESEQLVATNIDKLKIEFLFDITLIGTDEIRIDKALYVPEGNYSIPNEINGKKVISIGNYAFEGQTNMTYLLLPNTIESIGEMAFLDCLNLTCIFAYNTQITRVEPGAFLTGTNTVVYLPDGITYIGELSFAMTNPVKLNLTSIDLSDVTYIGDYAFTLSKISEFKISSALSYIGEWAFTGSNLKGNIYLPSTLTTIKSWAFSDCDVDTIYTEKNSKPSSWDNDWNYDNRPVVWGCTFSNDKSYVVSVNKTSSSISNSNASGGVTNPGREDYTFAGWYTTSDYTGTKYDSLLTAPNGILYAKWEENACVASGTLITLADGTQKAVEELTGEEELLVWNMFTGEFDSAPVLFIDSDPERYYEVVNLYFSNGTTTKVISEHAFWDIDLNKYVFLRDDAAQYIGHWFNKQTVDENGNMINTEIQLINVVVQEEYTTAWSPVTYGYLCYYVNGMLSMPGATTGLINIFEVDAETMTIDQEAYLEDVEEYGLFTYEEFNAICPVPEIIFEAFGGQYLKVSLGKGLITWDELETLIARYAEFWD